MDRRRSGCLRSAAAAALLVLASLSACGDRTPPPGRGIALTECRLARLPFAAQCGTLEVPENRDAPDHRKIAIAIAVLPANTLDPRPDPLFVLAGGPGQAASQLGPFAAQMIGVRKDRDIVLVDQRGTGRSAPLSCDAFEPDRSSDALFELDPMPKAAACAKELAAKDVDTSQYTTAATVADLEAVRAAMGYPRINLWGGSYGTRVALEYMRRHPDRVRSAVLDGVAPPSQRVTLDVWPTRDAALSAVLAACAQSPSCRTRHPHLDATLAAVRDRLGPGGREVEVTDPDTGETHVRSLTFDHLLAAMQPLLYAPELQSLLPEIIARAAEGDYAPLYAAASRITGDLSAQTNAALHYSVTCAEDVSRVSAADAAQALAQVRSKALAARALAVCDVWRHGSAPADAATPVASEVPVLLLSGGLDPVTPPANGAEVAKTLPNSRHIVARGYGHIVSTHACAPRLIASFVDAAGFATLPVSCVEHFEASERPMLWPNRLGPQP